MTIHHYESPHGTARPLELVSKNWKITYMIGARTSSSGSNETLDFALAKGLHNMSATSISELTSDHNPVSFDISLNMSPPLSTFAFPNWHNFQAVLSESIPGNPTISNKNDIDQTVTNLNNRIEDAIHATSTYKAIHHPITNIPRQLREKIKHKNRLRQEWQQTIYPPLKTQINKFQRKIKGRN
ncbi:putative RNA-directed DNA polymerase from transposon X-element [Trichonephila clavipes]|nr:putative RNA-directed DNA polymerase from transposon X-element [Trichonephila clavipes]